MSMSELHDWECAIERLGGENAGELLKIAQDIYNTAFVHGIPLPKGHGRLIDADVFEKRLMDARSYYVGEKADDFDLRFAAGLKSAAERLVDAPTIIEANKESEDKK